MQNSATKAITPRTRGSLLRVARLYAPLLWYPSLLAGVTLVVYARSVTYGLHWDDPTWFGQGRGMNLRQLLVSLPSYQFYRPLAIALNQALTSESGIVNAEVAHLLQVLVHLLSTLALVPLFRRLGANLAIGRVAALLFALHPFAYQAVAWEAPQQPIATLMVIASLLLASRYLEQRRWPYLAASALVYLIGLLFQESVVPSVWLFGWLALDDRRRAPELRPRAWLRPHAWVAIHLGLACGYLLLWSRVPRQEGITGLSLQTEVLAFFLQGVVYPLAAGLASIAAQWSTVRLLAVLLAASLALAGLAWASGARRIAVLGLLWTATSTMPGWVGLPWEYVQTGSRLLYPALPGISLLWAAPIALLWRPRQRPAARAVGALCLVATVGVAAVQLHAFEQLTHIGTGHLQVAIQGMTRHPGSRQLYVNFPDRLAPPADPYPLGYWGLTLAPVVQDLEDYAAVTTGARLETRSLSYHPMVKHPWGPPPYRVDLRGEHLEPIELV